MKNTSARLLASVAALSGALTGATVQEKDLNAIADEQFAFAATQYTGLLQRLAGNPDLPRTFANGKLKTVDLRDWTAGFFPGSLWLLFEQTGDPKWKTAAVEFTRRLEANKDNRSTHDLGFMLYCSYGQGWRLTHEPADREVLLAGARSLASRFNPKVGLIQSWGSSAKWKYPVIIDNMMNLELLMFAHRETGEAMFRDIAVTHANNTLKNHFRADGSSFHVLDYDPATGAVVHRQTAQGFSDDSAWARGQSWGLYGYTMIHRLTGDAAYLAQARKIADFLINHPRLPADKVPYWDYDAADQPRAPRDASAAAIMASALIELGGTVGGADGERYLAVAAQQLRSLASPAYRAALNENGNFLLMHCTGHLPEKSEIDVPLVYADYYFLEALARWKARSARQAVSPAPDLASNPAAAVAASNPALPSLFIAGDSTAAKNNGNPIQGWGVPFADYFDPVRVNVVNRARGGRSGRTFITEGLWDQLLAEVKAGDYVLIQFGHNDGGAINEEPPDSKRLLRARGSLPGLGEESQEIDNVLTKKPEAVHTFGWYVRKMIADTKARGATPVVLSLTARDIWKDGKIERGSGFYRQWDREIAEKAGVQFVDLSRIVADKYQVLGEAKVKELFSPDHTHMNTAGADFQAACVVAGLKGIRKGPFEKLLSAKGEAVEADRLGWLNLPEPADPKLPSIVLIGDSTVRNGRGDGAGGQWGWGDEIGTCFDPAKINIVNRAVGGLSSRTFLTQGHWERALMLIKPGDFVLMQFGHNDGSALNDNSRARGTIKGIGEETQEIDNLLTKQHEVVHSYGWYLRKFIREARAAGATPIVCSPIPRKTWDKDGRINRNKADYGGWAAEVAQQEKTGFIDLNELIAAKYDELGHDQVMTLFPQVTPDEHTHPNLAGAQLNASFVTAGLRALPGTPLDAFLSAKGRDTPAAK